MAGPEEVWLSVVNGVANPGPVHFIIGTGRCGSTLVHEVICRHPSVAFLSNIDDLLPGAYRLSRVNGPLFRRLPASSSVKGRLRFAPSEGYRVSTREVGTILALSRRDLAATDATPWLTARLAEFVARRAIRQPGKSFIHKLTGWPRAGLLHAVFPEARFVHVVRDGRAVANSWLKTDWWRGYEGPSAWQWGELPDDYAKLWETTGHSFPMLAGIGWMILIDAWQAVRQTIPESQRLEVRYEDIVERPEKEFDRITAFLQLEGDAGFVKRIEGNHFARDRGRKTIKDLSPADLEVMTEAMAGHLEEYGYPTGLV